MSTKLLITKENNKEWVEKISYDIIYGIDGFLNGFIKTGNWDLIYSQLDSETMSNLIYNNIIWQLDNGEHSPCILEDIAIFTCEMCGKPNWVYDVIFSHKGKIIYVIGFSKNQKKRSGWPQGQTGLYYSKYLEDFKKMAIDYAKRKRVNI